MGPAIVENCPTAMPGALCRAYHVDSRQIEVDVPLRFSGRPYIDVPAAFHGAGHTPDNRTYAARLLLITTGPCKGG